MVRPLSELVLDGLLGPLQDLPFPASTTIPRLEPYYEDNVKISMTFPRTTVPWNIGTLLAALEILYHYLRVRDSRSTLEATIAASTGQRAALTVSKVPTQHLQAQFTMHEESTQLDTVDVIFYLDEPVSRENAMSVLNHARLWSIGYPAGQVIQVTDVKSFRSARTLMTFAALGTPPGWATMTFDEAYRAFTAIQVVGEQRIGRPWTVFRAGIANSHGDSLGRIQYLADWPVSDTAVPPEIIGSNGTAQESQIV